MWLHTIFLLWFCVLLAFYVLNYFCLAILDETRKILHEQECEKTLIALLTNEVVNSLNNFKFIHSEEPYRICAWVDREYKNKCFKSTQFLWVNTTVKRKVSFKCFENPRWRPVQITYNIIFYSLFPVPLGSSRCRRSFGCNVWKFE
jgi:predicted membrane chloride channel (bestrophin family)